MGSVIALVARHERRLVRAQAHRLYRVAMHERGVSRRLRRRVCVQIAAIAPQLAFDQLSLLVRHALWSYRFDNRIEAPGFEVAALARLRDQVTAVTLGHQTSSADPLLTDLERTVRDLSKHDQSGEVMAWYGEALRDAVTAEVDQLRLDRAVAAGASPPTAERYLKVAARNVNYRSFAYALLAVSGAPLVGSQLRCIDVALWHAAYAVRLANDVRGVAQDAAQATLNVLGLRTATGLAVTPRYAWDETGHHVRAHNGVLLTLTRLGVVPEAPVQTLTRSLLQAIRLYRHTDLR